MSKVQRFWSHEAQNIRCVREADFDALEAEAQALRDELKNECKIAAFWNEQAEKYKAEAEALRARVVVVPERFLDDAPGLKYYWGGYNACLDDLMQLNGKVVSEGLLRRVVTPALTSSDAQDRIDALEELRALLQP